MHREPAGQVWLGPQELGFEIGRPAAGHIDDRQQRPSSNGSPISFRAQTCFNLGISRPLGGDKVNAREVGPSLFCSSFVELAGLALLGPYSSLVVPCKGVARGGGGALPPKSGGSQKYIRGGPL